MPGRPSRTASSAAQWMMATVASADLPITIPAAPHLWIEKFEPQSELDLTVHRDKVRELAGILNDLFSAKLATTGGQILVISGPSGSGKTVTLRALLRARSLARPSPVKLVEWNDESLGPDDFSQLEDFVIQVGRYGAVIESGDSDIGKPYAILLKNLPTSIADSVPRFHRLLRLHRTRAQPSCLLVLVISSSSSAMEGMLPERLLCPPSLRDELGIRRVEFNPVAPSLVLKALLRITVAEGNQPGVRALPRTALQQLSHECGGDLRTAVNQLQFQMKSGWNKYTMAVDAHRDIGLQLFRVLGKILYCKREEDSQHSKNVSSPEHVVPLPPHLSYWKRPPLTFDLEQVLDQCHLDGDNIVAWLHENYLDFTQNLNAVHWSADRISWADAFLSGGMNWRLGLTPAADWNSGTGYTTSGGIRGRHFYCSASRHYPALVVARSLLLADGISEESTAAQSSKRMRHARGFHPFRSPSTMDCCRVAADRLRCLEGVLTSRCQSYGLTMIQQRLSNRHYLVLDWLPNVLKTQTLGRLASSDDSGTIASVCSFTRSADPRGKSKGCFKSADTRSNLVLAGDDDLRLCPPDAAEEGDALPIEECDSDTELGRNR
ncbi:unnamed protein product [Calicophoron daubneyi]|uniref:Cell cycle checkpoint protein RAD17 n=1 Tax=Calicophoron daubneyi TaxID=300641 RepID=A0AAV2T385_CALDB